MESLDILPEAALRATVPPALHAEKISWRSDDPVWIDQWPLTQEKIREALLLVQEQLDLGHLEPSVSPWNTPIFVIKKEVRKMEIASRFKRG